MPEVRARNVRISDIMELLSMIRKESYIAVDITINSDDNTITIDPVDGSGSTEITDENIKDLI